MKRFLSWGIGLQSTVLGAMSVLGELEKLDAICHSDTQNERDVTLQMRDWYTRWFVEHGQRVEFTTAGNILQLGAVEHIHVPFWTSNGGPLQRQCTANFKIMPNRRLMRTIAGYHPSKPPHPKPGEFELWLGITWDEWERMSTSDVKFIDHRYPLIEKKMTRKDCETWLNDHKLPIPPKSACIICPYRSASEWLDIKQNDPGEWSAAVEFDEANRHNPLAATGAGSTADALYIYNKSGSPEPLATADLESDAKRERRYKKVPLFVCTGGVCWT